jgi:hypothetical protein
MNSGKNAPRLLGAAFLFVIFFGLSDLLLTQVVGSGSISGILVNISDNLTLMRISIIGVLVSSIGIIVLAALLYITLNRQSKIIALVALGWWFAEAMTLAASKIGALALIPLSQEFIEAGTPEGSYFQTLGNFLYYGFDRVGYDMHMLFFCLGGILWFYLFYRSRLIPRAISLWGIVSVSLMLIYTLLTLFGLSFETPFTLVLTVPYLPFELFIGIWLITKGFNPFATGSGTGKTDINF